MSWSVQSLGDFAQVANGKTPSKAEKRNCGHPVLKIRDVDDLGEFRGVGESYVDPEMASRFRAKWTEPGDTLILNAAHNADYVGSKTFFVTDPAKGLLATGEWLMVRPDVKRLDNRYAYHWLTGASAKTQIKDMVKGIHLYPKDVARLRIPLPTLPEQQRIAAILDQADALRRLRDQTVSLLLELRSAIFREMFGSRTSSNNLTPIGEIVRLSSGSPLTATAQRGGSYPVFGGNGINGWHDTHNVPADTIVLGRVGVYCGAVHKTDKKAWVTDNALVVTKKFNISTCYLADALHFANLNQYAGRSAQPLISGSRIYPVEIFVPDEEQQNEYELKAGQISKQVYSAETVQTSTKSLFASLQHRAFRGEL